MDGSAIASKLLVNSFRRHYISRINRLWCFLWWRFQDFCCGSRLHNSGAGRLNEEDKRELGTWGLNSDHVIQSSGCVCYELGRFTASEILVSLCGCLFQRNLPIVNAEIWGVWISSHACEADQTPEQHPEIRDPPF